MLGQQPPAIRDLNVMVASEAVNMDAEEYWSTSKPQVEAAAAQEGPQTDTNLSDARNGAPQGGAADQTQHKEQDMSEELKETQQKLTDADLAMVLNRLIELTTVVQESGYGSDIAIMAGAKAFVTLARMVISLSSSGRIAGQVTYKSISLAGYNVELMNAVYTDLTTSTTKKVVDDHKLVAVALDAPFRHYYCALDDVDAGLLPMPFYGSPEKKQNPSSYEIVGKSKPMPVPVTKAICWATVTAE